MKKSLFLLFGIFFLSSCTTVSNKLENFFNQTDIDLQKNKKNLNISQNSVAKINFCPSDSSFQLSSEDEIIQKFHLNFKKNLLVQKTYTFIEKSVILSLIEMKRRPDLLSPNSRLQIYLKINNQNYYFDFIPKNAEGPETMPYLMGLDYLMKTFNPQNTLSNLAKDLDQDSTNDNVVSNDLEIFLKENQKELSQNETFVSQFFKGDEILTKYETFKSLSLKSILDTYTKLKMNNFSQYSLTPLPFYKINSIDSLVPATIECNYDINLDQKILHNDQMRDELKSHPIAFMENKNTFLAVGSSILQRPLRPSRDFQPFFKIITPRLPLPTCQFKGHNQNINLFSTNGKNPLQHFQHLISYDISKVETAQGLNEILSFSRHLFLKGPDRILYESKRGRKSQLDFFLSMNFPIYHVESLGNIFGEATFENKTQKTLHRTLVIDERSPSRLWCK